MNRKSISNENNSSIVFCELRKLEQKIDLIKRLRYIRNEILSNCAYHEKNITEQLERLEKLNTPKSEIDLIIRSGDISFNLSNNAIKDYNYILTLIENNKVISVSNNNIKTIKDIKKEKLINAINNI